MNVFDKTRNIIMDLIEFGGSTVTPAGFKTNVYASVVYENVDSSKLPVTRLDSHAGAAGTAAGTIFLNL